MLRNTAKCLLLLICSWLLLGPQFFLQLGAWAWMLTSYSQEGSFQTAVRETFSGERPCGLCHIIEDATDSNPDLPETPGPQAEELRLVCLTAQKCLPALKWQAGTRMLPTVARHVPGPDAEVPVPPPRLSA